MLARLVPLVEETTELVREIRAASEEQAKRSEPGQSECSSLIKSRSKMSVWPGKLQPLRILQSRRSAFKTWLRFFKSKRLGQ